jgi:hypothetical protein
MSISAPVIRLRPVDPLARASHALVVFGDIYQEFPFIPVLRVSGFRPQLFGPLAISRRRV